MKEELKASFSPSTESLNTPQTPTYSHLLNLSPLPAPQFHALDRARNLALQMIAAKLDQADGVFIPDLCNSDHGLLNDDGSAGDLLLPWRTTALAITGAKPLGSLRLAGGGTNYIFARDHQLVIALWNEPKTDNQSIVPTTDQSTSSPLIDDQSVAEKSVTEQVTLGDRLAQIDLWGRVTQLAHDNQGQSQIAVGRAPIFITNLDEPLVRWQLNVSLEASRWPSQLGVPITDALSLTNPYPDSVSGIVRLSNPQRWRFSPRKSPLNSPLAKRSKSPSKSHSPTTPAPATKNSALISISPPTAAASLPSTAPSRSATTASRSTSPRIFPIRVIWSWNKSSSTRLTSPSASNAPCSQSTGAA